MKRIDYIVGRLDGWAEWMARRTDGGATRCSVISSIYSGVERVDNALAWRAPGGAAGEADMAAVEIDRLLIRLGQIDPAAQQALVLVHWRGRRDSMAYNARRIGIGRNALFERCCRGDCLLDRWLRELHQSNLATNTAQV